MKDMGMGKEKPPDGEQIMELVRQRRRLELSLRESEKNYRDLLDHLPVGVYRTTPDGRIIEANRESLAAVFEGGP